MFGLRCVIGRPTSAGIRFSTFSAIGVKRRMRRSSLTITMAICTLPSRLTRSLLTRRQLLVARVQLLVDGVELLVGRLQLLLGGVELLVGRLQLLVAREDLLVGRLQLLVGGLELLDDRLQVLAAWPRAPARRARRAGGRPSAGGFAARRRRRAPGLRAAWNSTRKCSSGHAGERDHLDVDVVPAAVRAHAQAVLAHGLARLAGRLQGRAQAVQQALARHLQQVQAGVARRGLEERARSGRGTGRCRGPASTTTPGGANRSSMTRFASLWTRRTSPRGSARGSPAPAAAAGRSPRPTRRERRRHGCLR